MCHAQTYRWVRKSLLTERKERRRWREGRNVGMVNQHFLSVWYVPNTRLAPSNLLLIYFCGRRAAFQYSISSCLDCFFDFVVGYFWTPAYRNTGTGLLGCCYWEKAQSPYRRAGMMEKTTVAEMECRAWTLWGQPALSWAGWPQRAVVSC